MSLCSKLQSLQDSLQQERLWRPLSQLYVLKKWNVESGDPSDCRQS